MNNNFTYFVLGMGTPKGDYPGQFTPAVEDLIQNQIDGFTKILHLFSGSSKIGNVRVDINHPHATHQMDVVSYLESDQCYWDLTVLDPPYAIERKEQKLSPYGIKDGIGGNTAVRMALNEWAVDHTARILWLDRSAPMVPHFKRKIVWFLLPGGYRAVRVLSLLENQTREPTKRKTLETWIK